MKARRRLVPPPWPHYLPPECAPDVEVGSNTEMTDWRTTTVIESDRDPWVVFAHVLGSVFGLAVPAGVTVLLAGLGSEADSIGVALVVNGLVFGAGLNLLGWAMNRA